MKLIQLTLDGRLRGSLHGRFYQMASKDFFNLLKDLKINKLIDIRLRPNSQLSGFQGGLIFHIF